MPLTCGALEEIEGRDNLLNNGWRHTRCICMRMRMNTNVIDERLEKYDDQMRDVSSRLGNELLPEGAVRPLPFANRTQLAYLPCSRRCSRPPSRSSW